MEMDESAIVRKCQAGELENFGALYDAYVKKIYNFIYFRTHHKETAEDLTSVAFTKALEKIGSYKAGKGQFSTWLYQIARNTVIDHYRTFKSAENIEDVWDLPSSSNPEKDADIARQMEMVKKYLHQLPSLQRDIVIMRVWDGLSHKEIAQVLGITEANCKTAYSRALGKINQEVAFALLFILMFMTK